MMKRGRPVESWYSCPVCGYPTLKARGDFQVCHLCSWEDDGEDDPESGRGGPNGDYTLKEARANWTAHQTMYRPGSRGFEMAKADLPMRRVLIAVFEAICQTEYRAHHQIRQLWRIAAELSGAGYTFDDQGERDPAHSDE
jgi:Cysteine-rich CPCC